MVEYFFSQFILIIRLDNLMTDQWNRCYDDGWQGDIVPEAFSHPAKFSRGLIHRIYKHAKEQGWVNPGDCVLDPFGGVGLGALDAICMGLNWVGCELEPKFSELAQKNFLKWSLDLRGWPNLGTARMVNGDSRNLKAVIAGADIVVISPPFTAIEGRHSANKYAHPEKLAEDMARKYQDGTFKGHAASKEAILRGLKKENEWIYGHTPGNLANMKEGSIDAVISSPPYSPEALGHRRGNSGEKREATGRYKQGYTQGKIIEGEYGEETHGQLGSMKEGNFDICVSSPPYEEGLGHPSPHPTKCALESGGSNFKAFYSDNNSNNVGDMRGDTFWSAAHEIVSQCYDLLKPRGHAIWVCKDYVKNKKRVPFSDRWLALNESVGFKLACRHQAMLVKDHGTQITINGEEKIQTERKSFFRRLAESKGSPRIDWEDILCLEKT